jgi:hypothetical protein
MTDPHGHLGLSEPTDPSSSHCEHARTHTHHTHTLIYFLLVLTLASPPGEKLKKKVAKDLEEFRIFWENKNTLSFPFYRSLFSQKNLVNNRT